MEMEGGREVPVGELRGLAGSMSSALEGSTHHLTATVIDMWATPRPDHMVQAFRFMAPREALGQASRQRLIRGAEEEDLAGSLVVALHTNTGLGEGGHKAYLFDSPILSPQGDRRKWHETAMRQRASPPSIPQHSRRNGPRREPLSVKSLLQ
ncbi:hypothetical protein EYF80_039042 [Liparis tanakae]|uniref:Uncharacterized protein n=1 Tax=Liparis tanakae TaxID=230148 RepID=A0A4Z2GBW7_9TELE|nr:hypothetical protein EYF80_039042 [Liparis tanakae]